MRELIRRAGPLGMSLVLGLSPMAPPAHGQDQFILTDEDAWEAVDSPDLESAEGQLAMARRALAAGDAKRAEYLAGAWIKRFPNNVLQPQAYLIRGDALHARGNHYKALFDYEYIARVFPGSEAFITAAERELEIARLFAHGTKRRMWGLRLLDASDEAQELLIRIQERLPGSRLAEEAGMELADFYFRRREMDLAADMYAIFIENYPHSDQLTKARRRLIYAHLASFKGPDFDATGLHDARALLEQFRVEEPAEAQRVGAEALLTRIDESDAQKLLRTARWYLRTGDVIAADYAIRRLLREFPRSVAATDASRLMDQIRPRLPGRLRDDAGRAATPAAPNEP
ncbi:MAG: tetratricopeptide repeat protein [Planctomycetota bacterium]